MKIIAQGIDLIECQRIRDIVARHEERFIERVLTPAEAAYVRRYRDPIPSIAGRFAAKEAIVKVLGTGLRGTMAWQDMEILNDGNGQPHATLSDECQRVAQARGITRVLLSITHTSNYGAAVAIGVAD